MYVYFHSWKDLDPTSTIFPTRASRARIRDGSHGRRRSEVDVFHQCGVPLGFFLRLDLLGPIVVGLIRLRQGIAGVEYVENDGGGGAHSVRDVRKITLVPTLSEVNPRMAFTNIESMMMKSFSLRINSLPHPWLSSATR